MRELVVVRYQESLDWLPPPLLAHFDLITVYNKGSALAGLNPKIKQVVLQNIGREGHTYLTHRTVRGKQGSYSITCPRSLPVFNEVPARN